MGLFQVNPSIHCFTYNGPPVIIFISLSLKFKVPEHLFLNGLDVTKKGIALGLKDVSYQLTCWRNSGCGRIEGFTG